LTAFYNKQQQMSMIGKKHIFEVYNDYNYSMYGKFLL
jgi:hypothetical protein